MAPVGLGNVKSECPWPVGHGDHSVRAWEYLKYSDISVVVVLAGPQQEPPPPSSTDEPNEMQLLSVCCECGAPILQTLLTHTRPCLQISFRVTFI